VSQIILYIPGLTPRITYAVGEIFRRCIDFKLRITEDETNYLNSDAAVKLHYTNKDLPGHRIFRSGFMDETGIRHGFSPPVARIDGVFCLFTDEKRQLFDLPAMVFWCLTRYEEYQQFIPDKHGRFPASASLLFLQGVLEEPVCDRAINAMFSTWGLPCNKKFSVTPTLDIDIAFAHAGRDFLRSLGAMLKNPAGWFERLKSLANPETDPNCSYPYINNALKNHIVARVFWHCGSKNNRYDKQVKLNYNPFLQAIQNMDNGSRCGLHPSFEAFDDTNILLQEKLFLEQALDRTVADSRMHYILLSFPKTYHSLLNAGITNDYSMGYPDAPGFRAGSAQPFLWYDLSKEQETELWIHPFCIMEATCKYYVKQTPEQAILAGKILKERVRENGGDFCFIFHNESLGRQPEWRGWNKVFEAWLA
jgi:hypothetical protein